MHDGDSFSLFSSVKTVSELLRRKLRDDDAQARGELEAGLQEIEALWEELRSQSLELASERQRYAEFFEYAPDAYIVTDASGAIRDANRAAAELLGVPAAALAGKPLVSFVPEPDRREFRAATVRASAQPDGELSAWRTALQPRGAAAAKVQFRVRSMPSPDNGLASLCWLLRRTE